jgi:hypothetical protein
MGRLLIFAGLGLGFLAPFGAALARPPNGPIALVIAPPWMDTAGIVAASGGRLIGPVQSPFAVLAESGDPGFSENLLARGIWAVRDGSVVAQLCGTN